MRLRELARIRAALRRLRARAHQHLADQLAQLHVEVREERARREQLECERALMTARPFSGPMRPISIEDALRGARQRSQPRWREEADFYARNCGQMIDIEGELND